MTVSFNEALAAYNRVAKQDTLGGMAARDGDTYGDFAAALRDATEASIQTYRTGEAQTLRAAVGEADIQEVVSAMAKAEMTLNTVVTLRDRAIEAYQEVLRMPI